MSGPVDSILGNTSSSVAWATYWEVKNNPIGDRPLVAQQQGGGYRLRPATLSFSGPETPLAKRTANIIDRSKAKEAIQLFLESLNEEQKQAARPEIEAVQRNGFLTGDDVCRILEKSLPQATSVNCVGQNLLELSPTLLRKFPQRCTLEVSAQQVHDLNELNKIRIFLDCINPRLKLRVID